MQIAIIGFGETGSCIASLIIHHFSDIRLDIIDPSDTISGRILDVQHAAAFRNIEIVINDNEGLSMADYVFYCAGIRNDKHGDRTSVTAQNKELIEVVFGSTMLKSSTRVIVVTNPVELISTWISEFLNHKVIVVGTGTLLDTYRFKFLLSKELKVPLGEVETIVLGEHGLGMTPILTQTTVYGKSIHSFLSPEVLSRLIEELKDSAKKIRLTEEATKFGVSECALFLLRKFESDCPVSSIASAPVPTTTAEELKLNGNLFLSLKCMISKNGIESIPLINLSEREMSQMKAAGQRLMSLYKI